MNSLEFRAQGQTNMLDGAGKRDTRLDAQKLVELPAASPLLPGLLSAINNDDITIREFAALIRQEPAIAARIIGLSNSAYFGQSVPITSVDDAIFKALGLQLTKSLALSIAMTGSFSVEYQCDFDMHHYWREAVLAATLARNISVHLKMVPRPNPDDAYISGLLHDFGMLPLLFLYHQDLQDFFHDDMSEEEIRRGLQEILLTDHHQMGEWVANKWQIPENIVAVIGHYHEEEYEGEFTPLVNLMHGVVWMVRDFLLDQPLNLEMPAAIYLQEKLRINAARLQGAMEQLVRKKDALETVSSEMAGSS